MLRAITDPVVTNDNAQKPCSLLPSYAYLPFSISFMEPTTGIEPVNLILTKDVLYLLSYVGKII